MNENRTFGVELELMCKHDRHWVAQQLTPVLTQFGHTIQTRPYEHNADETNRTIWFAKPDGSLNIYPEGFVYQCELVSPVLKGSNGLRVLEAVCNWLVSSHAFKVTKKCGMHVHHGAHASELAPLCRKWFAIEKAMHKCLPGSRKNNYYCKPWYHMVEPHTALRSLSRITALQWYQRTIGTRYTALNLESFTMRGTVEFRNAAGTFEAAKVCNWVLVTQAIIEANGLPLSTIETFEQLAAFLGNETAQPITAPQEIPAQENSRAACFGNHRRGSASALVDEMLVSGIHLNEAVAMLQARFANYANAPKTAERKFKGHVTYLIQRGVRIERTGTYYKHMPAQQEIPQPVRHASLPVQNAYAGALAWLRGRWEQFSEVPIVPCNYSGML